MPVYVIRCTKCGPVELFTKKFKSFDVGFCPRCGRAGPKVPQVAGLPPFKSYLSDALSRDSYRPVLVDSREKEKQLCRECNCARVS
jgi:hypothetical protein